MSLPWTPYHPPPPHPESSCLISHFTLFLCASQSFPKPTSSGLLCPLTLPSSAGLYFPCLLQQPKQNNTRSRTGPLTKKRTAGKKTLLTKETSTFKCLWEGLQHHLLAHMWNFQQSAFLLGEVGKKQAPQTGRLSKSKELQTSHSSSALLPAPFIWTRPLLFFFTPLTWKPCCKNSKSQALPTAVSHDSETKRLIGMHLKEVLGLGDSGKIITARSFLCLLIFLNLYGRSTGLLCLNAFFIIILIVHCRIKIPTVDLLHYSTN